MPTIVLWAWERAEDLRFLGPYRAGVAFLAATARIEADGTIGFQPRTAELLLPEGIPAIAVARIDSAPEHADPQPGLLINGLRRIADMPGVRGLQIDFDARRSERRLRMHVGFFMAEA